MRPADEISESERPGQEGTSRTPDRRLGFDAPPAHAEPHGAPLMYIPVLATPAPRWRDRLAGLVGLVAVVVAAATVLAVGVYQAGHIANRMIEGFLSH